MTSRATTNGHGPELAVKETVKAGLNGAGRISSNGTGHAPRAMILAAGQGTRLKPLTDRLPKPMVPIGGKPLLEHTIELLARSGVHEIAINLHAHADAIAGHFGDGSRFGVRITYAFEPRLLGTAGAVKALEAFFSGGPFFVVYGDVFTQIDPLKLMAEHRAHGALATIALRRPDDATQCGIVRQDGDGWITGFVEKPQAGDVPANPWANAGLYVLEPAVLRRIAHGAPQDFGADVFGELAESERALFGYRTDDACWDVGSMPRLREVDLAMRSSLNRGPRHRAIERSVEEYIGEVAEAVEALDRPSIAQAAEMLLDARDRGNTVYIIGNGGSATTASHMAADLSRASAESEGPPLNCRSLCDNVAVLSAWANDVGYDSIFTLQLSQVLAPGDVVVAFSASGKSPNILAAVGLARDRGASVLGLSGFGGGPLSQLADVAVVIDSGEYGPVEDLHLVLNHLLAATMRRVSRSEWDRTARTSYDEAAEPETLVRGIAAAA